MDSVMTAIGYIGNIKTYNNQDGSTRVLFSVISKTNDPKRRTDNKEKDFWNCNMYVPQNRGNFLQYITQGKAVMVTGKPYMSADEKGNKWFNLEVNSYDGITFAPQESSNRQQQNVPQSNQQGSPQPFVNNPQPNGSNQGDIPNTNPADVWGGQ